MDAIIRVDEEVLEAITMRQFDLMGRRRAKGAKVSTSVNNALRLALGMALLNSKRDEIDR